MDPLMLAGIIVLILIILILLGMPIAFALFLIGFLGYGYVAGFDVALGFLTVKSFEVLNSFSFVCIPLFVAMGLVAAEAGFVTQAFDVARKWVGRLPGGLAASTTLACAAYGAVSGSSAAMAASMGVIAYPEMRKLNYNPGFSASCIAVGATIGILIPPSLPMILYGIILDTSIAKLFIAGILPGLMLTIILLFFISTYAKLNPRLAPTSTETHTWKERIFSLKEMLPIIALFIIVIGGIYGGIFTPSEAAALGAFAAVIMAVSLRRLNRKKTITILTETGLVCGMLFLVILGAIVLSDFMIVSGIGRAMGALVTGLGLPKWGVLMGVVIVFLFLGMLMDVVGLFMITLPIFTPIMTALGFDLIFFGVFATILAESCLITPPVGLNVYVLAGVAKDTSLEDIFKRVLYLLPAQMIVLVLIVAFPQIATWLPGTMR